MLKRILHVLKWLLIVFAIEGTTGVVRAYSIPADTFVMFFKYFGLTLLVYKVWHKTFGEYRYTFYILTAFIIVFFFYEFFFRKSFANVAYVNDLLGLMGFYVALLFIKYKDRWVLKMVAIAVPMAFASIVYFNEYRLYNFYAFKTFSLSQHQYVPPREYSLKDKQQHIFHFERDKLYVLDFWNTNCYYCFKGFPEFNRRYTNNAHKDIVYMAINVPIITDTPNKAFAVMEQYDYQFPVYVGSNNIRAAFGTIGEPVVIAIRNDTVYYKGYQELLDGFMKNFKK